MRKETPCTMCLHSKRPGYSCPQSVRTNYTMPVGSSFFSFLCCSLPSSSFSSFSSFCDDVYYYFTLFLLTVRQWFRSCSASSLSCTMCAAVLCTHIVYSSCVFVDSVFYVRESAIDTGNGSEGYYTLSQHHSRSNTNKTRKR